MVPQNARRAAAVVMPLLDGDGHDHLVGIPTDDHGELLRFRVLSQDPPAAGGVVHLGGSHRGVVSAKLAGEERVFLGVVEPSTWTDSQHEGTSSEVVTPPYIRTLNPSRGLFFQAPDWLTGSYCADSIAAEIVKSRPRGSGPKDTISLEAKASVYVSRTQEALTLLMILLDTASCTSPPATSRPSPGPSSRPTRRPPRRDPATRHGQSSSEGSRRDAYRRLTPTGRNTQHARPLGVNGTSPGPAADIECDPARPEGML